MRRPFGSIENRHGVNEPGYEPPEDHPRTIDRVAIRGERLQTVGRSLSTFGKGMMALGCLGFIILIVIAVGVSALHGGKAPEASEAPPVEPSVERAASPKEMTTTEQESEANAALRVEENQKALERQKDPNEKLCIAANLSPIECRENREAAEAAEAQMHREGIGP